MTKLLSKDEYFQAIEDYEKKIRNWPVANVGVLRKMLLAEAMRLQRSLEPEAAAAMDEARRIRDEMIIFGRARMAEIG